MSDVLAGQAWSWPVSIYGPTGILTDPSSITVTATGPTGATLGTGTWPVVTGPPVVVTKTSTGVFSVAVTPAVEGLHGVKATWTAAGWSGHALESFNATTGRAPIVSVRDIGQHLNVLDVSSPTNWGLLSRLAQTVSAACESWMDMCWSPLSVVGELHDGGQGRGFRLWKGPVRSISALTVGGVAWAGGYTLHGPSRFVTTPSGFPEGVGNVAVAYLAGGGVVPANITHGCLEMARHIWETQGGNAATRRDSPDWAIGTYTIPRRVQEMWQLDRGKW